MTTALRGPRPHLADHALVLRIGLGLVFVIGGWSKLGQLLDPMRRAALVDTYLGPLGYVNAFFADYLFEGPLGAVLSPWGFLTALSGFELASGLALIAGFAVRPLALIYGFLLWTFVFALPVATVTGLPAELTAIRAPAILVQIRDIGLSGLMFALYNLGSGRLSVDAWLIGDEAAREPTLDPDWIALLARLSLAGPLLVGGFFAGLDHIQTYGLPSLVLVVLGAAMLAGLAPRWTALAALLALGSFVLQAIDPSRSLIANLNGFKREIAFLAAAAVLASAGRGGCYTLGDIAHRTRLSHLARAIVPLRRRQPAVAGAARLSW